MSKYRDGTIPLHQVLKLDVDGPIVRFIISRIAYHLVSKQSEEVPLTSEMAQLPTDIIEKVGSILYDHSSDETAETIVVGNFVDVLRINGGTIFVVTRRSDGSSLMQQCCNSTFLRPPTKNDLVGETQTNIQGLLKTGEIAAIFNDPSNNETAVKHM